jgi:deoxyribodipyrimidine photo-lyase
MGHTFLWFRHNLRLTDNPAIQQALAVNQPIIPVFIWDPAMDMGSASRWWLHHSLNALDAQLRQRSSQLIIAAGPTAHIWSTWLQPGDRLIVPTELDPTGQALQQLPTLPGDIIHTPPNVLVNAQTHLNQQGKPFQVFTPFWRAWQKTGHIPAPIPAPAQLPSPAQWPPSVPLAELGLLPAIPWDKQFYTHWTPGEAGAQQAVDLFLQQGLHQYQQDRNRPDKVGTSRLSPHLHFGEIGIADLWHRIRLFVDAHPGVPHADVDTYLKELGWREFAQYLLWHFPHTVTHPLRESFARFPWQENDQALRTWQQGQTGYPIVDAGMRQLWATGWMHNRVRMIVASFLVKHLRLPWQAGAAWFWDTLVDADAAANALGWSAGCGADAAPYFRVFNPVLQGEKFDPQGQYVRAWVPELQHVPTKTIHKPWESQLAMVGQAYPLPMVDHVTARAEALAAFQSLSKDE